MSFVLDSSIALSWCFPDERTDVSLHVLSEARRRAIFVPPLWHLEVANVIGIARRTHRIDSDDLNLALRVLGSLEIHTDLPLRPIGPTVLLPIMQQYELTAYDAAYFELASRLKLPMASLDTRLCAACESAGIELVRPR